MGGSNDQDDDGEEWSCCNDAQSLFVLLYTGFAAITLVFGPSVMLKPMRLITTFLHEMSHAIACWITGGHVVQLQVYENEGGVTRYIGGSRCLIIPAGYIGASFWSMIFVILSGGRRTATFAACAFSLSLVISLCYSPNRAMVYLCLSYAIITLAFIIVEWFVYTPILQFVILFYGVACGFLAIGDINNDTIMRSVEGSDATACSKEVWPCCAARCIGVQWIILAVFFQCFGIWIALVQMSDECDELGWVQCVNMRIDFADWDLGDHDFDWGGLWDQGP